MPKPKIDIKKQMESLQKWLKDNKDVIEQLVGPIPEPEPVDNDAENK